MIPFNPATLAAAQARTLKRPPDWPFDRSLIASGVLDGCRFLAAPTGPVTRELMTGRAGQPTNGVTSGIMGGIAKSAQFSGNTDFIQFNDQWPIGDVDHTIVAVWKATSYPTQYATFFGNSSDVPTGVIRLSQRSANRQIDYTLNSIAIYTLFASSVANDMYSLVMSFDASANEVTAALYNLSARTISTSTTSVTGAPNSGNANYQIGTGSTTAADIAGFVPLVAVFDTVWSQEKQIQIAKDPFRLIRPDPVKVLSRIGTPPAAGGATTLTAAKGTYNLTGQAANTEHGELLTAAKGDYNLTGQAATLRIGFRTVAAKGDYNLTGQAALFARTFKTTADKGDYNLTGQAATLTDSGAGLYQPVAVDFDGTNDHLVKSGTLTGAVDGKQFLFGVWLNTSATANGTFIAQDFLRFNVTFELGTFTIVGENASGTEIFRYTTSTAVNDGGWHHFVISADLTDTGKRHAYLDDVSHGTFSTYTNDSIEFSQSNWRIGSEDGTVAKYDGCMAQLYFALEYLDLSIEANRRKIIGSSAGSSVDFGTNGSDVTGTQPIIYLDNPLATWQNNLGSGGGFTENGALTACATSPPNSAGGISMVADKGSYNLTGQAAVFPYNTITADQGSYNLTGQAANTEHNELLTAVKGDYNLTGQAATTSVSVTLTADQGSYTLTGQATTFRLNELIPAAQGSYTLTGQDATTTKGIGGLTADKGDYNLTGQTGLFSRTYRMVAVNGDYQLVGMDLTTVGNTRIVDTDMMQLPIDYQYAGHPQGADPLALRGLRSDKAAAKLGKMLKF